MKKKNQVLTHPGGKKSTLVQHLLIQNERKFFEKKKEKMTGLDPRLTMMISREELRCPDCHLFSQYQPGFHDDDSS